MSLQKGFSKRNFGCGQYDKEMSAVTNEIQQNGLYYCRNVLSSVQGELKTRPGTKWLHDIDSEAVIIPFRQDTKDMALVFTPELLQVMQPDELGGLKPVSLGDYIDVAWANTANNVPAATAVSVSGNGLGGNTNNIYKAFTQSVKDILSDYTNNRLTILSSSNANAKFQMYFENPKALSKIVMEIMPANGSFLQADFDEIINLISNVFVQYSDDGIKWTTAQLIRPYEIGGTREAVGTGSNGVKLVQCLMFTPQKHKYWQLVVEFSKAAMGASAAFCVRFYRVTEEIISASQTSFKTPYSKDELKKLKYSQNYSDLMICDGVHNPYKLTLSANVLTFTKQNYGFIDTDGVPSCVRFFQNRLFFGGFKVYPYRVRGSKFGDFNNFTINTGTVNISDPISADCNQLTGAITDLWGGFNILYAQTQDGIAFLESQSGIISPNDTTFTLKCYEGGAGITPTMKENIMFYVGADKKKIHAFNWDESIGQFVAPDISKYWQEVLKSGISELHYVNSRDKPVLGLLEDGTLFSLLYDRSVNAIGYFPIDFGGKVFDLSVLKNEYETQPYIVVERDGNWTIEQIILPDFMERTNGFMQSKIDANRATKENITKTPYFDCWKAIDDTRDERWQYNAETHVISPLDIATIKTDLAAYVKKDPIIFIDKDGNKFLTKILEAYTESKTETRTETKEITTSEQVKYYGWQYPSSIVVNGKTYTRYLDGDDYSANRTHPMAWRNGSTTYYTWPTIHVGDVVVNRPVTPEQVGTITSLSVDIVYTKEESPSVGVDLYNSKFEKAGTVSSVSTFNYLSAPRPQITKSGSSDLYHRDSTIDTIRTETHTETITETVTVVVEGGTYLVDIDSDKDLQFYQIQLPITTIGSLERPLVGPIQIQDNGQYKGDFVPENGIVKLKKPMYDIQYGYPYRKIAVIQDNESYLRKKKWGTIALSVMDTMSLQIGTKLGKMENVMKWQGTDFYNSSPIMRNGILVKNISDSPTNEKQLILMTDEGLPFCVRAIEASGEITDRNQN